MRTSTAALSRPEAPSAGHRHPHGGRRRNFRSERPPMSYGCLLKLGAFLSVRTGERCLRILRSMSRRPTVPALSSCGKRFPSVLRSRNSCSYRLPVKPRSGSTVWCGFLFERARLDRDDAFVQSKVENSKESGSLSALGQIREVNQMLRSYDDIRSRIKDAIRWWDDNGVPRYCDFSPEECGVYDVVVALVEVGCQACMERFRVAVTFDRESLRQVGERYALPTAGNIGTFRYGDPPFHSHGTG